MVFKSLSDTLPPLAPIFQNIMNETGTHNVYIISYFTLLPVYFI